VTNEEETAARIKEFWCRNCGERDIDLLSIRCPTCGSDHLDRYYGPPQGEHVTDDRICGSCLADLQLTGMRHNEGCSDFALAGPRVRRSSEFKWHPVRDADGCLIQEIFEAGPYEFNIQRAKGIITKKPREVLQVPVEDHVTFLEICVELEPVRGVEIDVTFPVILCTLQRGGLILIDGWHRFDKALRLGLKTIPGVLLDAEETSRVKRRTAKWRKPRK
jgi:hypothetical protein